MNRATRRHERSSAVYSTRAGGRRGVSLIVALGVLAVFMCMVLAFAATMRSHRRSSRAFANEARARHLLHAAVVRAVGAIGESIEGYTYPYPPLWSESDLLVSSNGAAIASNLLRYASSGNVAARIPGALREAIEGVSPHWFDVHAPPPVTGSMGRAAFIVVNCSGLVDANALNATNVPWLSDVVARLPEIDDADAFRSRLAELRQVDSVSEIDRLADGHGLWSPSSNLFTHSFDPGPDVYFTNHLDLGFSDIGLSDRLNVNDEVDGNPSARLLELLTEAFGTDTNASERAEAVAWNLVNFLDADRLPRNNGTSPWLDDVGGEAVPSINELVLREVGEETNRYEVAVELWFPFYPATVENADRFSLQVGVFSNDVPSATAIESMSQTPPPDWCFTLPIDAMRFGASEFLVLTSPVDKRIAFTEETGDPPVTSYLPIGEERPVRILARVVQQVGGTVHPVDQAPGAEPMAFTNVMARSVADPRANGRHELWEVQPESLGSTNVHFDPAQDLPFLHRDGPMESIAEFGFLYASPGSTGWTNSPRRTVDLFDAFGGAMLADWLTVNARTNRMRGLINVSTAHGDVLEAVFADARIGWLDTGSSTSRVISTEETVGIVTAMLKTRPFRTFCDALLGIAEAYPSLDRAMGTHALRGTLERLTLRQNVFLVLAGAQIVSATGATVVAEKFGMAVVIRDAYTGNASIVEFLEPVP